MARPTVQAAARLDGDAFASLETALRADGLVGEPIHNYGTLTAAGERLASERQVAAPRPRLDH